MDLREFIEETITAIADATMNLQDKYEDQDVIVNPPTTKGSDVFEVGSPASKIRRVQSISFDVAVTAASEKGATGGAGIKVLSVEMGGKVSGSKSSESVSRVAFDIPMALRASQHEIENRKEYEERIRRMAETNRQNRSVV